MKQKINAVRQSRVNVSTLTYAEIKAYVKEMGAQKASCHFDLKDGTNVILDIRSCR